MQAMVNIMIIYEKINNDITFVSIHLWTYFQLLTYEA